MKLTNYFIPTLREEPQEAEIHSHKLMLKAGLIRRLASGIYSFLPLGLRSIKKIEEIVREEMNKTGALELLFPAMMPRELWEETGRWEIYGDEMFKLKDRKEREFCLGPTHEEAVVELARSEIRSYKELPKIFYQIQTKYRDEIRPRFGLVRAREFIMKDAYSFDETEDTLEESYKKIFDSYIKIFRRCDLETIAIEADSGAIGGRVSHEFVVKTDVGGESEFVLCPNCGYAANVEAAKSYEDVIYDEEIEDQTKEVETFEAKTIEEVSNFLKIDKSKLAKTLLYKIEDNFVLAVVRGDDDLNEIKLKNLFGANNISPATDEEVFNLMKAHIGAIGPINSKVKIVVDKRIPKMKNFVVGANKDGFHIINVNYGRDFKADYISDLRAVKANDKCHICGNKLESYSGMELGHTFKLGTKYSDKMKAYYLDREGKMKPYIMGCYGIGIGRTLQSVIEQHHDQNGIIFPMTVAPFHVIVVPLNMSDIEIKNAAFEIYNKLIEIGIETLIDDRIELSAGEKFNDADLIGIPIQVIIGKSYKNEKLFEIKIRKTFEKHKLNIVETENFIKSFINSEIERLSKI